MPKRKNTIPTPPCTHFDDLIGTIDAGDYFTSPDGEYLAVVTCAACAVASSEFVAGMTGQPANLLLPYSDARKASAA